MHVLMVEDDDFHAELLQKSLKEHFGPHRLDRVSDGQEALQYIRRQEHFQDKPRPDLILLDLKLPRVSGHDVLKQVKSDPDLHLIPIVVLTTSDSHADRLQAYENYTNSYLVKPVEFDQFEEMVKELYRYWFQWNRSPEPSLGRP